MSKLIYIKKKDFLRTKTRLSTILPAQHWSAPWYSDPV